MKISPVMFRRDSISVGVKENAVRKTGAAEDADAVLAELHANFDNAYTFRGAVEGSQSNS